MAPPAACFDFGLSNRFVRFCSTTTHKPHTHTHNQGVLPFYWLMFRFLHVSGPRAGEARSARALILPSVWNRKEFNLAASFSQEV